MTLKVIGAGLGRTGTMSLQEALQILGLRTHHMRELIADTDQDPGIWTRAIEDPEHPDEWDKAYEGYEAAVDWPTASFYKELMEKYPDAKIILTVRDPESWYESINKTLFERQRIRHESAPTPHQKEVYRMIKSVMFDGRIEHYALSAPTTKQEVMDLFLKHNQQVIETVPAERLLVLEVGEGWSRLCQFLDMPVPDVPYPCINQAKAFIKMADALDKKNGQTSAIVD
ncbi:P-loop containing nucleoside triphosphate hydrolase protein [Syncephalastrum racemosum]|uniref:P-loop containing nucleoside triphosphate hydrolase protein n=1 Tax=Syncephalastrum racemosum TaxID=13706 RepID=A0A1X2HMP0_SYNRA|nr:P-loop containing nucleoside triphosphate hydrolase protein [Syncephalastrum racemosum]